jgi:hypothetical protein
MSSDPVIRDLQAHIDSLEQVLDAADELAWVIEDDRGHGHLRRIGQAASAYRAIRNKGENE